MDKTFVLIDLEQLSYFLGFQIHYLKSGFLVNQAKYVEDLLFKLNMTNVKATALPCVQGRTLSKIDGQPLQDLFVYRSTVGALQYLTHTRPDIAYMVNHLSQFLQKPKDIHWRAVKQVLRYVSTKNFGILFQPSFDLQVTVYSDIDWASNVKDRKSVAAYCAFVGNSLVSWARSKQLLPDQVLNLNTGPLPMRHQRLYGFNNY